MVSYLQIHYFIYLIGENAVKVIAPLVKLLKQRKTATFWVGD